MSRKTEPPTRTPEPEPRDCSSRNPNPGTKPWRGNGQAAEKGARRPPPDGKTSPGGIPDFDPRLLQRGRRGSGRGNGPTPFRSLAELIIHQTNQGEGWNPLP